MPATYYDVLTARDEYADAGLLDAVNLRVNHVDANLILVDHHELVWEVRSEPALRDLERAAGDIGLHVREHAGVPVPVPQSPADRGHDVYRAIRDADLA